MGKIVSLISKIPIAQMTALMRKGFMGASTYWSKLSKAQKIAVATAVATAGGAATTAVVLNSSSTDEEVKTAMNAMMREVAETGDVTKVINTLVAFCSRLPADQRRAFMQDLINGESAGSLGRELYIEMASMVEQRVSATAHTGDGGIDDASDAKAAVAAYERIKGAQRVLARAAQVMGLPSMKELRYVRDAIFMDEQLFSEILELD